jgi:hypothetical protein
MHNRLAFPFRRTVAYFAGRLAAHSGGTVRDFHPLPFSLAFDDEHLREFSN